MSPQASSEEKAGDGPPPRPATPATRPPSSRQQQRKLERQQQEAASAPAAAVAAAPATAAPATADAAAAVPTRLLAAAEALDPAFASFDVVQEAPVFHPTAEEFTDPLGYIAKCVGVPCVSFAYGWCIVVWSIDRPAGRRLLT